MNVIVHHDRRFELALEPDPTSHHFENTGPLCGTQRSLSDRQTPRDVTDPTWNFEMGDMSAGRQGVHS